MCKCPLAIQELFLAFIAHIIHMASHQLCHWPLTLLLPHRVLSPLTHTLHTLRLPAFPVCIVSVSRVLKLKSPPLGNLRQQHPHFLSTWLSLGLKRRLRDSLRLPVSGLIQMQTPTGKGARLQSAFINVDPLYHIVPFQFLCFLLSRCHSF